MEQLGVRVPYEPLVPLLTPLSIPPPVPPSSAWLFHLTLPSLGTSPGTHWRLPVEEPAAVSSRPLALLPPRRFIHPLLPSGASPCLQCSSETQQPTLNFCLLLRYPPSVWQPARPLPRFLYLLHLPLPVAHLPRCAGPCPPNCHAATLNLATYSFLSQA